MSKGLRGLFVVLVVGALAVLPTTSSAKGGLLGGLGELVASDFSKGKSAVAVASGVVLKPGKMTAVVTSSPRHKVAWGYTTDCFQGVKSSEWPPPGSYEDTISQAPIRKKLKTGGLRNPDFCKVEVSAKVDYNSAKSVTAKIFNK